MKPSESQVDLVFLLDVDNTLLDNDRLKSDLDARLRSLLGDEETERFWQVYEDVRRQEDFVDFPATIRRWSELSGSGGREKQLWDVIDEIDFRSYLYPRVIETIEHLWSFGTVVILSDGDTVFQPLKIQASGLEQAVRGNVVITVHKELEMKIVFSRFPADHYVIVDDKPRILSIFERECPTLYTTVLVLQGKYAAQRAEFSPKPDITVNHIADLRRFGKSRFIRAASLHSAATSR